MSTFQDLVLMKKTLTRTAVRIEDREEFAGAVAADPSTIGFVGLPYVGQTAKVAIAERGGDPPVPTPFTIKTEDYPISRRLHFYVPAAPKNPLDA